MSIRLKRAYEEPSSQDGCRILVERLWPRGVSREDARIDLWARDAAPSTALRKWFGHDPGRWTEFKRRYAAELRQREGALDPILARVRDGRVTFVYGSREERHNAAVALAEIVARRLRRRGRS